MCCAELTADTDITEFLVGPAGLSIALLVVSANVVALPATGVAGRVVYVVDGEGVSAALRVRWWLPYGVCLAFSGSALWLLLPFAMSLVPFGAVAALVAWLLLEKRLMNYQLERSEAGLLVAVIAVAVLVVGAVEARP